MFDELEENPWEDAEKLAFEAFEHYENGELVIALDQLQDALEINPQNSAWYFNAGLTLDAMERYTEAITAYEEARQLCPDDPEILNSLAVDYTRLGQYDLAISIFEEIEQITPEFEAGYCNRIITYTEMDLHDQAEHMFYLAQQINPDCPICFYNIGNSLFIRQLYKKAIWCWEKTATLDPTHPQINYRIAQAHWADNNVHRARVHFLKELRENPGNIDVILDFGICLLKSGDFEGAKEKFNRILELNPNFADTYFYLGELALTQNDQKTAEQYFNKTMEENTQLPGPRYRLAQLSIDQGDTDKAAQHLNIERMLDITDTEVLLSMTSMFIQINNPDNATDCLLRIIDQDSENLDAFHYLAVATAMRKEYEGALEFCEHAINLGNKTPDILADTAYLYLRTNRLKEALKTIIAARLFKPQNKLFAALYRKIQLAMFKDNLRKYIQNTALYKIKLLLTKYKCRIRQYLTPKK